MIQRLSLSDLPQVLALETLVLDNLPRPDLLRRNTAQMWQSCLQAPHVALGDVVDNELVAVAVLYIPAKGDAEDLAQYLSTFNALDYKSANYKICLVHPQFRGHGRQQQLGRLLEDAALQLGVNLLCSTVSPYNTASILSLQKLGYIADSSLTKYGFVRQLYYKIMCD